MTNCLLYEDVYEQGMCTLKEINVYFRLQSHLVNALNVCSFNERTHI